MSGSPIAIWHGTEDGKTGWFWDDAEDHGGFDRISPQGPFADYDAAKQAALDDCGAMAISRFEDGRPAHYN